MLQSAKSVIRLGGTVRRCVRGSFILCLSFLILLLLARATYPSSNTFHSSLCPQRSMEANRDASQNRIDAITLDANKPIERALAGGEAHAYQLALAAGQFARIDVEQRGINVAVSAFDAGGKKLIEVDEFPIGDSESVSLIAESATIYRLEVRSPDQAAPQGRYEIKIKEVRVATEQDKSLIAAERLIAEGVLLEWQPSSDSMTKAIEKFQKSIPFCQSAKATALEATALYLIGDAYIFLGEKQKALDFANQALMVVQEAVKQPGEEQRRIGLKVKANTLVVLGRAHNEFGDKKKALELLNQALPLSKEIGDRSGEANTLNQIGASYHLMGDHQKAFDAFNQSLLIARELRDRGQESLLLNNMCVIRNSVGEYKKAMDFCNQALSIRHELKFQLGEATTLNNIGNSYTEVGEYQKALDSYNQAQAINKIIGNSSGRAVSLNNIGYVYAILGEYEKAINFYNQALEIFRAEEDHYREAHILNNIAANYANLGDYRKALEIHQQVYSLRRNQNDSEGEAVTLTNIASTYSNLGEQQKALEYFNQAIALHRKVGNPRLMATALKNNGSLYQDLGDSRKAMDCFNEGLQLSRAIGDRNGEAGILAQIALVERDRGNLIEAKTRIEEALTTVESLRINTKSQQLRVSFFASVRNQLEFYIDLLMRLHKQHPSAGFDAAALQASEKGRARSLLELLTEAGAEIRQGVDPVLLEREHTLRQIISDKANRQMQMLSGKHTEEQATTATREIDALTTEYDQIQARIREKSPQYAALTQPVPLGLKEIQTRILDEETLLLEYALGEQSSFLWAVTPTSIKSFELPKRAEIEQQARRIYELLTARNKSLPKETLAQRQQRLERAEAEYSKASATLSQMLVGPVAAELKNKRLLIAGDGILQYVPFAALPNPEAVDAHPLVVDNEIVSLPSASVLAVLRQETAGRKSASKTLAVLADPVFSKDDPRVPLPGKRWVAAVDMISVADAKRSAAEAGLAGLDRLRFSRQEADEITRLAADNLRLKAVDFAASRPLAMSGEIGQYRIVHFAAHGLINNQHPELSGVILSLVDQQGHPQNGFLRLYDIYNLKLNADLVVLSACQTALGKEIRGEGIVGLTRGFMYAGARRVVASLWKVDDRATAELMRRLYSAMLGDGARPAAALRAAQVSMWREQRWQSPYYWAAFTLQGEWK